MKWLEVSEIVSGLALQGKINPHSVVPDHLIEPYDKVVGLLQAGQPDTLVEELGVGTIQTANAAADRASKLGKTDWLGLLERSYQNYSISLQLDKISRKLADGERVDQNKVASLLDQLYTPDKTKQLVPMSEITPNEVDYLPLGFDALDRHIGGLPEVGMSVLSGLPGTGKTTLAMILVAAFTAKYKDRQAAVFSLEMTSQQLTKKAVQQLRIPAKQRQRILVADQVISASEISAIASRAPKDVGLIVIDFAEMMLTDEDASESTMAAIYLSVSGMAKRMRLPVLLIAQMSRKYEGGLPKVNHLRYSAMAEILSALILFTYNPKMVWAGKMDADQILPIHRNKGYLIAAKTRFGTQYPDQPTGAIELPWDGTSFWKPSPSTWYPLNGGTQ